jgi:hypothetical protein
MYLQFHLFADKQLQSPWLPQDFSSSVKAYLEVLEFVVQAGVRIQAPHLTTSGTPFPSDLKTTRMLSGSWELFSYIILTSKVSESPLYAWDYKGIGVSYLIEDMYQRNCPTKVDTTCRKDVLVETDPLISKNTFAYSCQIGLGVLLFSIFESSTYQEWLGWHC